MNVMSAGRSNTEAVATGSKHSTPKTRNRVELSLGSGRYRSRFRTECALSCLSFQTELSLDTVSFPFRRKLVSTFCVGLSLASAAETQAIPAKTLTRLAIRLTIRRTETFRLERLSCHASISRYPSRTSFTARFLSFPTF